MRFTNILNTTAIKLPSPAFDPDLAYSTCHSVILDAAKVTITRISRKNLLPTWDDECQQLYDEFIWSTSADNSNALAEQLMKTLNERCRKRWELVTAFIDYSHPAGMLGRPSTASLDVWRRHHSAQLGLTPLPAGLLVMATISVGTSRSVEKWTQR